MIPYKSSAKDRPTFFPKALYRARARIEQLVGKLKRFKRVALRCEKTSRNYGSIVAFALGLIIANPSTRPRPRQRPFLLFHPRKVRWTDEDMRSRL